MFQLTIKRAGLSVLIIVGLAFAVQVKSPGLASADTSGTLTTTATSSSDQTAAPITQTATSDQAALAAAQAGVNYLAANQNTDGSIAGSPGATEWSAIAVEASGQSASDFSNSSSGVSANDFIATDTPAPGAPATDVERDAIAVAATGGNTTDFAGTNYDATLASYDNANQIGDPTLLNDDIFGVIAADATQDPALKTEAQDGLNYFLANQGADGGFSYTTDSCAFCGSDSNDTAAAIIAMNAAVAMQLSNPNLAASQASALTYLLSTQQPDGGFGYDDFSPSDGSSTAWALMALNSVGETVQAQALAARNWLLADQNPDGGFSYGAFGITNSDTYTTAHAIIALLGTTWLLQPNPIRSEPLIIAPTSAADKDISTSLPMATLASTITNPMTSTTPTSPVQTPAQTVATTVAKPIHIATKATNVTSKSTHHYVLYGVLVLALIAAAWYVLQSSLIQGEA
jgi:hypothetical protein